MVRERDVLAVVCDEGEEMIERTERTICDVCGVEISRQNHISLHLNTSPTFWHIPVLRRSIDEHGTETETKYEWFDVDLCPGCMDRVTSVSYDVVADGKGGIARSPFQWRIRNGQQL